MLGNKDAQGWSSLLFCSQIVNVFRYLSDRKSISIIITGGRICQVSEVRNWFSVIGSFNALEEMVTSYGERSGKA